MPTDAPFTPPKKKISIFWWLGGLTLVLGTVFLFQLIGPSPRIIISKQTTYITTPLLPNGLPDYEAYMREKLREGVTSENNAAVLLLKATGPGNLAPDDYEAIAAEIGLDELPASEAILQPLYGEANQKRVLDWLPKPTANTSTDNIEIIVGETIGAAQDAAWTSKDLPPLAEWIAANQGPLDVIVEATRRPRYYLPAPELLNDQPDMLIGVTLQGIQSSREAARSLATRATWHVGENRLKEAWQDNLAIYRLSDLVAQGTFLVDHLVALAIRGNAIHTTNVLLNSDHMTKELAQQIERDISALPRARTIANCVDHGERIFGLDSAIYVRSHGVGAISQLSDGPQAQSPFSFVSVDWNVALKKLNRAYDQAAAAMRISDYDERQAAFELFETELNDSANGVKTPGRLIAAVLSRNARSDLVGTIITSLLLPALTAANAAEDRNNSLLSLTQLAASLAAYRAEHGSYPERLDDLVPAIIPQLPVDIFHAKPFVYRQTDDGYLLYSIGPNGKDDGGNNEQMLIYEGHSLVDLDETEAARANIAEGADDFSIRLPRPPFKLPKPTAP